MDEEFLYRMPCSEQTRRWAHAKRTADSSSSGARAPDFVWPGTGCSVSCAPNPSSGRLTMSNTIYLIPFAGVLALIFAFVRSSWISRQDAGTPEMKVIAGHIREGAMAFLTREYRVLAIFVI